MAIAGNLSEDGPLAGPTPAILFYGMFLGVFAFTFSKVIRQTIDIWLRTKNPFNPFLVMIWAEACASFLFATLTFVYMPRRSGIPVPKAFHSAAIILWAIQTQLLTQIIINRVALVMSSQNQARVLRWSLFGIIACLNIAVGYFLFRAARPEATPADKKRNIVVEHVQKSLFLVIDLGLGLFFMHLVRTRLIAYGLRKYWRLYNYNAWILVIATVMDVVPLCLLNVWRHPKPGALIYFQFTPLGYIVKLHIELTMAVLISKVVKSANSLNIPSFDRFPSPVPRSPPTHVIDGTYEDVEAFQGVARAGTRLEEPTRKAEGIVKTTETSVEVHYR